VQGEIFCEFVLIVHDQSPCQTIAIGTLK